MSEKPRLGGVAYGVPGVQRVGTQDQGSNPAGPRSRSLLRRVPRSAAPSFAGVEVLSSSRPWTKGAGAAHPSCHHPARHRGASWRACGSQLGFESMERAARGRASFSWRWHSPAWPAAVPTTRHRPRTSCPPTEFVVGPPDSSRVATTSRFDGTAAMRTAPSASSITSSTPTRAMWRRSTKSSGTFRPWTTRDGCGSPRSARARGPGGCPARRSARRHRRGRVRPLAQFFLRAVDEDDGIERRPEMRTFQAFTLAPRLWLSGPWCKGRRRRCRAT